MTEIKYKEVVASQILKVEPYNYGTRLLLDIGKPSLEAVLDLPIKIPGIKRGDGVNFYRSDENRQKSFFLRFLDVGKGVISHEGYTEATVHIPRYYKKENGRRNYNSVSAIVYKEIITLRGSDMELLSKLRKEEAERDRKTWEHAAESTLAFPMGTGRTIA